MNMKIRPKKEDKRVEKHKNGKDRLAKTPAENKVKAEKQRNEGGGR